MAVALHISRALPTRSSTEMVVDKPVMDCIVEASQRKELVRDNLFKERLPEMHRVRSACVLVLVNRITPASRQHAIGQVFCCRLIRRRRRGTCRRILRR